MRTVLASLMVGVLLLFGGFIITFRAATDAQDTANSAIAHAVRDRKRADYELCVITKENREALALLVKVIPEDIRPPYTATLRPPITCHRS